MNSRTVAVIERASFLSAVTGLIGASATHFISSGETACANFAPNIVAINQDELAKRAYTEVTSVTANYLLSIKSFLSSNLSPQVFNQLSNALSDKGDLKWLTENAFHQVFWHVKNIYVNATQHELLSKLTVVASVPAQSYASYIIAAASFVFVASSAYQIATTPTAQAVVNVAAAAVEAPVTAVVEQEEPPAALLPVKSRARLFDAKARLIEISEMSHSRTLKKMM